MAGESQRPACCISTREAPAAARSNPTLEERERLNEAERRYRESLKRFVWQAGDVTVCDPTLEERISEEERQLLLERMRRARERQDRMEREWNEAEREAR